MKLHKDTHFRAPPNVVADITCNDMDPSLIIHPPIVAEKVCKTVRFIGFLIQNGLSRSNMQDVVKRGKNIGKALNNAVAKHHDALTCRSGDSYVPSFISPLEYQFSLNGSPPRPSSNAYRRRRLSLASSPHGRHSPHRMSAVRMCGGHNRDVIDGHYYCPMVRRREKITAESSRTPMLRSAVTAKEEEKFRVDDAAEEFIERFYRELRLQKWLDQSY